MQKRMRRKKLGGNLSFIKVLDATLAVLDAINHIKRKLTKNRRFPSEFNITVPE